MNAKIIKGKSAGGLIDYLNNMKEKDAKIIFSRGVSTTSNQTVVTAFNLQWANSSSKIKDKMGHLIISFSPKDRERLTDEFVSRLCQEYMKRMNFPSTIYVAYRHLDHEHDHVHIAYSRIDDNGKAITCDSNYRRSVKVCQAIRNKYGLSEPSKRKKDVNRDRLIAKDKVRFYILDAAFPIFDKASSWKEYISQLAKKGIEVSLVKGKDGRIRGIVYTAEHLSFAGSKIDSELAYGNLCRKWGRYDGGMDRSILASRGAGVEKECKLPDEFIHSEQISATEHFTTADNVLGDAAGGESNNGTSVASGLTGAVIELALQPHQAPVSSVGGGSSNDDDKKKDKDKYVPRRRRR